MSLLGNSYFTLWLGKKKGGVGYWKELNLFVTASVCYRSQAEDWVVLAIPHLVRKNFQYTKIPVRILAFVYTFRNFFSKSYWQKINQQTKTEYVPAQRQE